MLFWEPYKQFAQRSIGSRAFGDSFIFEEWITHVSFMANISLLSIFLVIIDIYRIYLSDILLPCDITALPLGSISWLSLKHPKIYSEMKTEMMKVMISFFLSNFCTISSRVSRGWLPNYDDSIFVRILWRFLNEQILIPQHIIIWINFCTTWLSERASGF